MEYLNYEEIENNSLEGVQKLVLNIKSKKIKGAYFLDLLCNNNKPIETGNGVYLFFSPDSCCEYIGKASSRIFLDRIASHFDYRPEAMMNSFASKLAESNRGSIYEALKLISSMELRLINIKNTDNICLCNAIEALLKVAFRPSYTPASKVMIDLVEKNKNANFKQLVCEYLKTHKNSKVEG